MQVFNLGIRGPFIIQIIQIPGGLVLGMLSLSRNRLLVNFVMAADRWTNMWSNIMCYKYTGE